MEEGKGHEEGTGRKAVCVCDGRVEESPGKMCEFNDL